MAYTLRQDEKGIDDDCEFEFYFSKISRNVLRGKNICLYGVRNKVFGAEERKKRLKEGIAYQGSIGALRREYVVLYFK